MTEVHIEDLLYPASVSLLGAIQLARFARRVGEARGRYKIPVPEIDGDRNFRRIFRAQQNNLEFYPIFITLLWTSSIFLHHAIPSVFGLIYLYARQKYFYGYAKAAGGRLPGFRCAMKILMLLFILSIAGLASTGYTKYTGRKVDVSFCQERALEVKNLVIDLGITVYKWISKASETFFISAGSYVGKAVEKIPDVVEDLSIRLQVLAKVTYSQGCLFADKVAEMLFELWKYLAQQLGATKSDASAYFKKPINEEL